MSTATTTTPHGPALSRARKLIAFVADHARSLVDIIHHGEPTSGDLIGARRMIITARADLDELDQCLRAAISARIARPNPLVPALVTDRDVDDYKRRLESSLGGPADGAEDEVLASIAHDRAIECRHPLMPSFRPTHRFSPRLGRLLAVSPAISSPGRKAV